MNTSLPVYRKKQAILDTIAHTDTVIVTAETGSGKSTQVPQMLYEAGYEVIVTEPRRVAAVTLATRVSEEMGDSNVVGYKTAFESTQTPDTKILFCTDGLKVAQGLKNYTNQVLVIDEVHEWNLNIETLIAWIKNFRQHGNSIKVIIMSATIDSDNLRQFFGDAELIHCNGTLYDVKMHEELHAQPEHIVADLAESGKNVLMFQPGKAEIDKSISYLKDLLPAGYTILPLHSELTMEQQRKVFRKYSGGKVIVATNIAQTSLTIPDIDAVVDTGFEKVIAVQDGIEGLVLCDISKADCVQRAGRAGRTKNGVYYLCSSTSFESRADYTTPEIQRLILDKVVLKLISVHINPHEVEFYHHVNHDSIESSIKTLKDLGALTRDENLTDIGVKLVRYPVGVKFGRMLISAEENDCLDEMILGVSIMEMGSMLSHRPQDGYSIRFSQYYDYLTSQNYMSDVINEILLYKQIEEGKYKGTHETGLNFKKYRSIRELSNKVSLFLQKRSISIGHLTSEKCEAIRECIIYGLRSNLMMRRWVGYDTLENQSVTVDRQSDMDGKPLLVGIPRAIQRKGRFGDQETFYVASMCTLVTKMDLIKLYPEIKVEFNRDEASYSSFEDVIYLPTSYILGDLEIYQENTKISKTDPRFSQLYEEISEKAKNEQEHFDYYSHSYSFRESNMRYWTRDDGKLFEVIGYYQPYILVSFDELDAMPSSEIKVDGESIRLKCENCTALTAALLKKKILENASRKLKESLCISKQKTFSLAKVRELIEKCGIRILSDPDHDIRLEVYIGLQSDNAGICWDMFDTNDEYLASTHEALVAFLNNHIKNSYSDKKFFVMDTNGKKMVTRKCEEAKNDFKSFCAEVLQSVTLNDFEESLALIDEMYNECQKVLGNYSESDNKTSMFG